MSDWKNEMVENMFPINPKDMNTDVGLALKYQNIPERLFKFCRFDNDGYYVKNLKANKVWLSSPEKLNDPYDCALTYSNQQLFSYYFKKNIRSIISTMQTPEMQFSEEEIKEIENSQDISRKLIELSISKDSSIPEEEKLKMPDIMIQVINEVMNRMPKTLAEVSKKSTVLTSFTEKNDSIIMWSHYAAYHSGFCVEYNFKQLGPKNKTNTLLYPIIYQNQLTDITRYLLTADQNVFTNTITVLAAITKSKEWEYEKEWRLLIPFGISKSETDWITPQPTSIYMGSKIEPSNELILKDLAQKQNITLYKAEIKEDKFEIIFNEIKNA